MVEAGYGYWGFSPANIPEGGYAVYGVDGIGSDPDGYPSNNDRTLIDLGWPGCRRAGAPDPPPSAYTNGVVTPHAAFLALRYAPQETLANLTRLERDFDIYTRWGFRDSVNVDTGERVGLLPVARPGHDHGRDRQRGRARRHAAGVRHS